jgi:hypothetical protein
MISDDPAFKRRVDAIHESGHAVVATALGLTVLSVELFSEATSGPRGICRHEPIDKSTDPIKGVITVVASDLAGPLAVFKRHGDQYPYRDIATEDQSTWKEDTDTSLWRKLSPDQQTRAFVITDYLLDRHWQNVLGLADEVFEQGIVTESSWLQHLPNFWTFPVIPDRREIVVHLPGGDERRLVNTNPTE